MKKKIICSALVATMLLTQAASAAPWQWYRNELIYNSEIEFYGNVTLTFASDDGSFIRPITKRYDESINHESCIPVKYEYIFVGWFTDPRTKQKQETTFKFTKPDVFYAKLVKDTCYPSLNTISDDAGISLSIVKRTIPEFASKGYLKKITKR